MKNIKMTLKETDYVLDFNFETEGDIGDYEKERLTLTMERILMKLMDTQFYNIRSFKFSVSDTKPPKYIRKKNRKHGLFVQHYNDIHQGYDLFFSWNGRREMNFDSRYVMSEFNKENGIVEYLRCSGYLIETIDFELRTIEKFY